MSAAEKVGLHRGICAPAWRNVSLYACVDAVLRVATAHCRYGCTENSSSSFACPGVAVELSLSTPTVSR